eukprot:3725711-Pleurochrysis_carterae.AAC.3
MFLSDENFVCATTNKIDTVKHEKGQVIGQSKNLVHPGRGHFWIDCLKASVNDIAYTAFESSCTIRIPTAALA